VINVHITAHSSCFFYNFCGLLIRYAKSTNKFTWGNFSDFIFSFFIHHKDSINLVQLPICKSLSVMMYNNGMATKGSSEIDVYISGIAILVSLIYSSRILNGSTRIKLILLRHSMENWGFWWDYFLLMRILELFSVENIFKGCCVDCILKIKLLLLILGLSHSETNCSVCPRSGYTIDVSHAIPLGGSEYPRVYRATLILSTLPMRHRGSNIQKCADRVWMVFWRFGCKNDKNTHKLRVPYFLCTFYMYSLDSPESSWMLIFLAPNSASTHFKAH